MCHIRGLTVFEILPCGRPGSLYDVYLPNPQFYSSWLIAQWDISSPEYAIFFLRIPSQIYILTLSLSHCMNYVDCYKQIPLYIVTELYLLPPDCLRPQEACVHMGLWRLWSSRSRRSQGRDGASYGVIIHRDQSRHCAYCRGVLLHDGLHRGGWVGMLKGASWFLPENFDSIGASVLSRPFCTFQSLFKWITALISTILRFGPKMTVSRIKKSQRSPLVTEGVIRYSACEILL